MSCAILQNVAFKEVSTISARGAAQFVAFVYCCLKDFDRYLQFGDSKINNDFCDSLNDISIYLLFIKTLFECIYMTESIFTEHPIFYCGEPLPPLFHYSVG